MAVSPLTAKPVSLTHNIRYFIIRNKAGLNFGTNESKLADPRSVNTLAQLIGEAGVDSTKYAIFFGYNLEEEHTNRAELVYNQQDVYFIHRELINLPPHLLLQ